jgi:hypothetical protein
MAPRAYWKGFLRLSLVSCPIQLFPATSEREKISFNQINKETGNRIRYRKVDEDTGAEVRPDEIVQGYQVDKGRYVEINDEEVEAIALESTRTIEIDEFVGSWLTFEPDDRSKLGRKLANLGQDLLLGSSVLSVEDKFRLRVYVRDFAQYEQFLPTETPNLSEPLADAVFFYIGDELDWDVELAIPSGAVVPVTLGQSGRLGWTTWVSPNWTSSEEYRCDARFHLSARFRARRAAAKSASNSMPAGPYRENPNATKNRVAERTV